MAWTKEQATAEFHNLVELTSNDGTIDIKSWMMLILQTIGGDDNIEDVLTHQLNTTVFDADYITKLLIEEAWDVESAIGFAADLAVAIAKRHREFDT